MAWHGFGLYTVGMHDHLQTGSLGEQVAANFLSNLGHTILDRNVRMKFGEIDIISRDPMGVLIFTEVKTLSRAYALSPEDNLTRAKFRKLSRACSAYANARPELVSNSLGWRIDLVAVVINFTLPLAPEYRTFSFGKNNFAVSRYENIS
ncbi:hypothetical protein A2372_04225 [Candidatus Wolfebacteria bacterium RIFOXYB1_FULL_54_12]|uniref:UPF0102 protein A2372_04225 n=1 Tax=Candidatus Wolfebacteria bacterium RIFOXYB1_FULL_54_12 TaxID=1802559 RepID=A0A1F8DVI2_9BACT|nr:MAG: hypothetical protein A2372_04225 [Candidatus Wolfebacteria bacterium RIFOXYB1_FULL_54_12]